MKLCTVCLVGTLAASCASRPVEESATGAGTDTSTTASIGSGPTTLPHPTTSDSSTTVATSSTGEVNTTHDTDTTDLGCAFTICPTDLTIPTKECDPWVQDCPPGEKCMPYSSDGDSSWDSLKCTPVAPNPGQVGDPCTIEGGGVSGIDSCDVGHMCWDVDINGEGTCTKFCTGSYLMPICDPGFWCLIGQESILILCLPWCDPLLQDCGDSDLCGFIPWSGNFMCMGDASGDGGQEFQPCEVANECDPGLFCADPASAVECDPVAPGCCLPFCDTTMPMCNGQGAECVPWFEMGTAPPGYENLGVCRLP